MRLNEFRWTPEAGGTQSIELRIVKSPDTGTLSIHNSADPNAQATQYESVEECKRDFEEMLKS